MAKGQLRSNREAKKPKQPRKPVAPAATFSESMSKSASRAHDGRKR